MRIRPSPPDRRRLEWSSGRHGHGRAGRGTAYRTRPRAGIDPDVVGAEQITAPGALDPGAVATRRAYRAAPSPPSSLLSSSFLPPLSACLRLSETLVTTFVMSLLAFLTASRTGVLRAGLAVAAFEPLSLRVDRTIVRPSPMTDFTAPMVWLIGSLVAASSRPTWRCLVWRSSWVTAGGFGSGDPTAV